MYWQGSWTDADFNIISWRKSDGNVNIFFILCIQIGIVHDNPECMCLCGFMLWGLCVYVYITMFSLRFERLYLPVLEFQQDCMYSCNRCLDMWAHLSVCTLKSREFTLETWESFKSNCLTLKTKLHYLIVIEEKAPVYLQLNEIFLLLIMGVNIFKQQQNLNWPTIKSHWRHWFLLDQISSD